MKPRYQIAIVGAAWGAIAALCILRWNAPIKGGILGGIGSIFLLSGLFIPSLARVIHQGLSALTRVILAGLTWILLGLSYFLFLTPLGLILRGTRSLRTARESQETKKSYWSDRPQASVDVTRYLRPF